MRLLLTRKFGDDLGQSVFGELTVGSFSAMTCEREWKDNEAGHSCVPTGFYALEPHNGTKYPNTWAIVGRYVSQSQETSIPRFACVLHWSSTGRGLQGCIAIGERVVVVPESAKLVERAPLDAILKLLNEQRTQPHYLDIREE